MATFWKHHHATSSRIPSPYRREPAKGKVVVTRSAPKISEVQPGGDSAPIYRLKVRPCRLAPYRITEGQDARCALPTVPLAAGKSLSIDGRSGGGRRCGSSRGARRTQGGSRGWRGRGTRR